MKTVTGNLIAMALNGDFDVIVHGCNCFCTMGAGIAKQIKETFPGAFLEDSYTPRGERTKLGSFSSHYQKNLKLTIVNGYTQYHAGANADYDAIRSVFREIKRFSWHFDNPRIGYPKIGAGIAGGDWEIISKIIDEELEGEDHTLVVLPETKQ